MDSSGDIYYTQGNQVLLMNAETGVVSVVAGNGTVGFSGDSGPATDAELDEPQGLALDNAGNLYIADSGNNRVRMVNLSNGIITTFAGNGTAGYGGDGGPATAAALNWPVAVAVDSAGNVFIADNYNSEIRVVSSTINISCTSITGNGTITESSGQANYGNQNVTFTITPAAGCKLTSLTDNGINVAFEAVWDSSSGTYTYTIPYLTSSHSIDASFAPGTPGPIAAPSPTPALSTAGIVLLLLVLGGILWQRRRGVIGG